MAKLFQNIKTKKFRNKNRKLTKAQKREKCFLNKTKKSYIIFFK